MSDNNLWHPDNTYDVPQLQEEFPQFWFAGIDVIYTLDQPPDRSSESSKATTHGVHDGVLGGEWGHLTDADLAFYRLLFGIVCGPDQVVVYVIQGQLAGSVAI